MTTLWHTDTHLDKLIETFTVGDDYLIDQIFLPYDIRASRAHAQMLQSINIISGDKLVLIEKGLQEILDLHKAGNFHIEPSQEDCHTAIEVFLTEKYGDIGKKIHTGRSRNDQSLTMIRLFLKDQVQVAEENLNTLIDVCKKQALSDIAMPGYTHMQKAMPTTVGTWIDSYHDALKDQMRFFDPLQSILDQSPLGSAAGFGIANFPNDRALSAELMGFAKVQENPLYCGISRGLFETNILGVLGNFLLILGRLNNDLLLFTTGEFSFFSLPENMTTGSSIMPQKRNYDVLELIRAKITLFFGYHDQMRNLYTHLISGYQRDLQMTKSIFLSGFKTWNEIIQIMTHVIQELQIHETNLEDSMTEDLFATEAVYKLVMQ
ncbi:MAG: lyase family protein [Candidatus Gracilibacteria bacterium]